MAKFFVGQRVRIVGATLSKQLIGTEVRVRALDVPAWSPALGDYVGVETDAINAVGNAFVAADGQLEPILPEGHRPSEFTTLADLLESLEVTA